MVLPGHNELKSMFENNTKGKRYSYVIKIVWDVKDISGNI